MARQPTRESSIKRELFTKQYGHRVEKKQKGSGSYDRYDTADLNDQIDEMYLEWLAYKEHMQAEQKNNDGCSFVVSGGGIKLLHFSAKKFLQK